MVEDRLTDGKRIAQLLASELDARESGPLSTVAVVDADPDATASEDGTDAYGIAVEDTRIGTVRIYPEYATIRLRAGVDSVLRTATSAGLTANRDGDVALVRVGSGAAVKRAVDAVVAAVDPE